MWFWKTSRQRVQDFRRGKQPQSDEEFIAACGLPAGSGADRVALGVRRVIAELGEVEREYIHSEAVFAEDINRLPFWDSLDTVEMVMALEEEFGVPILDSEAESIRNPELDRNRLTVREFVADVYRVIGQKIST